MNILTYDLAVPMRGVVRGRSFDQSPDCISV